MIKKTYAMMQLILFWVILYLHWHWLFIETTKYSMMIVVTPNTIVAVEVLKDNCQIVVH